MKTMTRILALALVLCMVALAGCTPTIPTISTTTGAPNPTDNGGTTGSGGVTPNPTDPVVVDQLQFKEGTVLRMATGYNSNATGLFFHAEQFKNYPNGITLANGKTYNAGDLKPTWVEVQDRLGMIFEDKYTGKSATNTFKDYAQKLNEVDMVSGSATQLNEYGAAGALVNIADYLDKMPNFKAYLNANPIVRLSISGADAQGEIGAIYFSPYFDGVNDIERMPLMRTDWVVKLLDGEGDFAAEKTGSLKPAAYEPYMPTSGKVEIDVVKLDGSATEKVTKDYDKAGNIVKTMNDKLAAGTVSGVEAVNMLRKYIDEAYNGYYGTTRSNLFVGQNAAWDADELVALLRCVVANAQTLNGTDTIYGLFSREDGNNQRRVDMFRFCGTLFGVRGLESRQDYLYVGADGKLHDARMEKETYEALERMNDMVAEGLVSQSFIDHDKVGKTDSMLSKDLGFMHYDYNQTQTVYNETKLDSEAGEKYMAVMVPVARWNDGTEKFMRFTESWRSVKTDGWAISVSGINGDEDKLNACLKLIDYAYSPEGQILMSYGPDEFIKTNADGSYVTFNFNGNQMPVIADATYTELWEKASGNYTNYARQFLGSTLSFVKSQAFEYQCTHIVGKEGAGYISNAIALGTIKHPELAVADNSWYTSVPTVLPTTEVENTEIKNYKDLTDKFSTSKDTDSATQINLLLNLIVGGYAGVGVDGVNSAESAANYVAEQMGGKVVLSIRQGAFEYLLEYYEELVK